jgi:hypothetical protein
VVVEVFQAPQKMNDQKSPLHFLGASISKPKWNTRDKILAFGFLLPVMAFGTYLTFSDLMGKSEDAESANPTVQETPQIENQSETDPWLKLDLELRKSLAEMKYRDAKQLEKELDELLSHSNQGVISVEMMGQAKSWRHGVDFILSEVEETGFKPGLATSGTAMSATHAALQSMKFAWDRLERFATATSADERESHAGAHANELKAMRSNLQYAREWLEKGQY